jgi:hypothetical protein
MYLLTGQFCIAKMETNMNKTATFHNVISTPCIFLGLVLLCLMGGCSQGTATKAANKVLDTPTNVQPHITPQGPASLNIDATKIISVTK